MSLLAIHPRHGLPRHLAPLGFTTSDETGGGSGDESAPSGTPEGDDPPSGADEPPAQGGKTDWKAEARKWEKRAKDNATAAETSQQLQQRLDKLAPLERLAEALGTDPSTNPSEVEQLADRMTKHEEELANERTARWRAEIGHAKGMTVEQAAELRGSTREEMEAHADRLTSLFVKSEPESNGKPGVVVSRSGTGGGKPDGGSIAAGRDMYKPRATQHQ